MNNNKIIKLNNHEITNISGGDANDMLQAQLMENLNATQILNEFCISTCGCKRECSKSNTEAYDRGWKNGQLVGYENGYGTGKKKGFSLLAVGITLFIGFMVGGYIEYTNPTKRIIIK